MEALLTASLVSFALATAFVRFAASSRVAGWAMDRPNHRSLHETPVPRIGGLALFAAAGVAWGLFADGALWGVAALTALLIVPSLADDLLRLSAGARFAAQVLAGAAFLASGSAPFYAWPFLLFAIVWMTNLYNFMDGSDGMAGGMAAFGFSTYAALAQMAGAADIAIVSAIVATAALGFLLWNFHPARIFLGDSGSVPLGFLAACIGVAGWERGVWPLSLPLLVFAPFILDATLTLLRRLLAGENIAEAHRTHLYQRLARAGAGHRGVALMAYVLMAVASAVALLARDLSGEAHAVLTLALGAAMAGLFLFAGASLPPAERPAGVGST